MVSAAPASRSVHLLKKRLRLPEVVGREPLGEPTVNRREEIGGFGAPALVAPEPNQAHGGAQFQGLGALKTGDFESVREFRFAFAHAPRSGEEVAAQPMQLRLEYALAKRSLKIATGTSQNRGFLVRRRLSRSGQGSGPQCRHRRRIWVEFAIWRRGPR